MLGLCLYSKYITSMDLLHMFCSLKQTMVREKGNTLANIDASLQLIRTGIFLLFCRCIVSSYILLLLAFCGV